MARRALVTGGAGFIGSHLVDRLLREGWRVCVLDDLSTGDLRNLPTPDSTLDVVLGDVRDEQLTRQVCDGVDSVFHLAALASVPGSIADPVAAHGVNASGTLNILAAARQAGVRRVVFSSSTAVYGDTERVPTTEAQPIQPRSPYASTKALGEYYCRNFWDLYQLETVVLRYFNVYGPRQRCGSGYAAAIPLFVRAASTGQRPVVYGDGRQTRDFVFVDDVVTANLLAATADDVAGQALNIASGQAISILGLLAELERVTGAVPQPEFRPARPGEIRHSAADIRRARHLLRYEPSVPFALGLRRTVAASAGSEAAAPAPLAA